MARGAPAMPPDPPGPSGRLRRWPPAGSAPVTGGNRVQLLSGGDELFPAMCAAIDAARHRIWLATYIFHDDPAAEVVAKCLAAAARRGVQVGVVVDGFGSKATLPVLRRWLDVSGVQLVVFRPLDRWWRLLHPGQLRRLHQKLCVIDDHRGFVGGINLIDDRHDLHHGWTERARLDFAVEVQGPVVAQMAQTARAIHTRARLGADWRDEALALARSAEPVARMRRILARLKVRAPAADAGIGALAPMRAAFVVRDNLRQRRAIEQAYIEAIGSARTRLVLVCPYFYPGRLFRRALREAARRGVQVRLLLQGKADYRFAALAAQVLYDEMLHNGVRVFEYMPAFLHAKVALVDDGWATVGSSNIDPLSLLLNLEANLIVHDAAFTDQLAQQLEAALAESREVLSPPVGAGWWAVLRRGFVAWSAHWFLRLAGLSGRY
jgi:cardiolipin synthase